ncbi:MAG: ribosome-associated ATPase/putative transporter RbbA [Stappiaceae bacterium]
MSIEAEDRRKKSHVTVALTVTDIAHQYGQSPALRGISFQVKEGETLAFVGPDGVGKSTLLSLIAGVKKIQAGTIDIFGGSLAKSDHRSAIAPRIAYMPQGLGKNLYPSLSVFENVDFFGRLFGLDARARKQRIERLLIATGLAPFPDRPAGKLSGGMKQKLGLCCSLVHDPDILILDEPTTGVDPLSRRQFWELVDQIRADRPRMSVLVATAYMNEAERFDRLIAMDDGRVLADGATGDILEQTGGASLEEAYVSLLPEEKRGDSGPLVIPPKPDLDGPPAITASGLTRRFGSFVAVDHVSFEIERGEIFGFLGSNGCGKTTTMKMLTGLLEASEGSANLLGKPIDAGDLSVRKRVGYVSQAFSLYEELSVIANLRLHAQLYQLDDKLAAQRIEDALNNFGLKDVAKLSPTDLPLGIRQRLQLAAAILHEPEVLILDEPTSGVDPAARDLFWRYLIDLSRNKGVTIFVSTHFMNEAERCDRISLMHAGRVLAVGQPKALTQQRGVPTLEETFIGYLEDDQKEHEPQDMHDGVNVTAQLVPTSADVREPAHSATSGHTASLSRVWAFTRRESVEIIRDPIRMAFAVFGPMILMITFSLGISFDVKDLSFSVLDRDQSYYSRQFIDAFGGSEYFVQEAPVSSLVMAQRRLKQGTVHLVIDIPPRYGIDLMNNRQPEVNFMIDGSVPFRGETISGYIGGIVQDYAQTLSEQTTGSPQAGGPINPIPRFRYNQSFESVFAITPGVIMLLLMMIPAMLTAVGVVREKEMGSILNLYASPATVGEFLIGKQLPYIVVGMVSFLTLVLMAVFLFGVAVKGSFVALTLGALLYVFCSTGFGLLLSSIVSSQVAAIFAAAILTVIPSINFSGFLYPASTMVGAAKVAGYGFPSSWFQTISIGVFAKDMGVEAFPAQYAVLALFAILFLLAARLLLAGQEK